MEDEESTNWTRRASFLPHGPAAASMTEDLTTSRTRHRALIVVSSDTRRGAEVFGHRLELGLCARGWEAQLVSLSASPGPRVPAQALSSHAHQDLPKLDPGIIRRLRAEAREVDAVLANGGATLRYTAAALAFLPSPPAFVYGSIGEPSFWARSGRARWQQRLLLRRPDVVAAVSRETAHQLTDDFGVAPDRIRWAPTGVVLSDLPVRTLRGGGPVELLFVGSLSAEKQPHLALEVVAGLPDARLTFLGDGPMRPSLSDEITRRGLTARVALAGVVPDPNPFYDSADLLLLTSKSEGLPGVAMEAAGRGLASVAFAVGGVGEIVVDNVTGRLIPAGRTDLMQDAVRGLADDAELRRNLGQAARRHVAETYTLESAVTRWEQVLAEAVAGRRERNAGGRP